MATVCELRQIGCRVGFVCVDDYVGTTMLLTKGHVWGRWPSGKYLQTWRGISVETQDLRQCLFIHQHMWSKYLSSALHKNVTIAAIALWAKWPHSEKHALAAFYTTVNNHVLLIVNYLWHRGVPLCLSALYEWPQDIFTHLALSCFLIPL